jgi:hypothetical protein
MRHSAHGWYPALIVKAKPKLSNALLLLRIITYWYGSLPCRTLHTLARGLDVSLLEPYQKKTALICETEPVARQLFSLIGMCGMYILRSS